MPVKWNHEEVVIRIILVNRIKLKKFLNCSNNPRKEFFVFSVR